MTKDKNRNGGDLSGEDKRLWDFVTSSIKPLDKKGPKRALPPARSQKPAPEAVFAGGVTGLLPDFGLKPAQEPAPPFPAGLDRRTAGRLRRGEFVIEARLDLHGLRQGEAQDRLILFLMQSYDAGKRCVLVITGKGSRFQKQESGSEQEPGVLRRLLPVWIGLAPLAQIILTHSKARPKDGGDGAFYILLRRKR